MGTRTFSFVVQDAAQGKTRRQHCNLLLCTYKMEMAPLELTATAYNQHCVRPSENIIGGPECKVSSHHKGPLGQYKNRFNFINLCFHQEDFGLLAEWNFFTTSHGKTACDGIGGTACDGIGGTACDGIGGTACDGIGVLLVME